MSKRQLTADGKAKQDAARKGIAALRRASPTHSLALTADERNARAQSAVLAYMHERGLLNAAYTPQSGEKIEYSVTYCKLDWNEAAAPRARTVRIQRYVEGYWNGSSRDRRNRVDAHWETVATVDVPHWDYDGVDPLVAREPWERAGADAAMNSDYYRRPWGDNGYVPDMDYEVCQMEACERLNEDHAGLPDAATFSFTGSRDWC